jgi:hypothetical protein
MEKILQLIDSGELDPDYGFDIMAAMKASNEDKDEDELYQEHVNKLLSESDPITGAVLHSEE